MSALQLIVQRMPATLELAASALVIAVAIGIPLGMYAGYRPRLDGRSGDHGRLDHSASACRPSGSA